MAHGFAVADRLKRANTGEQHAYDWLAEGLNDDYDVWHEPPTGGKRPDVVVFGPSIGLLVLEVKDWSAGAVESVEPARNVHLRRGGGTTKSVTHPVEQAEGHLFAIKELLERVPACVQPAGAFRGRIRFPFAKGAIFPNMSRNEVEGLGLCAGYEPGWIVSGDEMGRPGNWLATGAALVERLRGVMKARFAWDTSDAIRTGVRSKLSPETIVARDFAGRTRGATGPSGATGEPDAASQLALPIDSTRNFSEEQRRIALELSGSHQLLQGVAGSGKSEVVAMRARILVDANPSWSVLVLCYNVSLAAWLRSRVFEGGALQKRDLTVLHFHEWARLLLDRAGIELSAALYRQPDAFPQLLADALRDGRVTRRYDAILVDEAQDFTDPMLDATLAALAPGRETLLLAMDNAQRIYDGKPRPLSSAGFRVRGHARVLKTNLRCSREINEFSRRFLWGDRPAGESLRVGDHLVWVPESSDRSGPPVTVARLDTIEDQARWAAQWCLDLVSRGYEPGEIAVLYTTSRVGVQGEPVSSGTDGPLVVDLVELLTRTFDDARVPLWWLAEDRGTKADAVIEHSRITLSTVHSFKGLEARNVVLFGADLPATKAADDPRRKALLYVGMTRATDRLAIPWSSAAGLGAGLEILGAVRGSSPARAPGPGR